ncbi:helix-turn-helix domain-containing protein [Bhargavaea cecembensis]|uniref:helix-turn-helix domain-containing protein n=1 Tax=Bhargavaea cecembensis TaxID=394098 RepID=UPI0005903004|nr:helix-turn-helix transcriptional regulator [Bhargavaea cecembensis]
MPTLGERIRLLRKERKLTLDALAGDRMSKGMLSLIENNKAKPSMESLSYIAERLGVPSSELLEEVSANELRNILEQAEELTGVSIFSDKLDESRRKLMELIAPYAERLGTGYESARLLELYGRALHALGKNGWEEPTAKAAEIYDRLNITARRAAIGIFRAQTLFTQHEYAEALAVLLEERKAIESRGTFIEPMTRLDFDYLEAVLYYAVGGQEEAARVMDRALKFSREKGLYYRMSDWYRLAAIDALMSGKPADYAHYMKKLRQYADFADDEETTGFIKFLAVHELNSYEGRPEAALSLLQEEGLYAEDGSVFRNAIHSPFFALESGKALSSLGRHEEAVERFGQMDVRYDLIHHPIDLSLFLEGDAYLTESLWALGRHEEAAEIIRRAYDRTKPLIDTPYKDRVRLAYDRIIGGK